MRGFFTASASLVLGLVAGCGKEAGEDDVSIPLTEIPPAVMKIAEKELPGVKFDSAFKETKNGEDVFEVRGKTKEGKIRDVEVTAKGKVVEVN
jgi:uncharacterized membrane protein YkoI